MTTVQYGTSADYDDCVELMRSLPSSFTPSGIDNFVKELPKSHLMVVKSNDNLLGFITLVFHDRKLAEITWLAVAPNSQGKGLGTQLVRQAEQAARDHGTLRMEVKTLAEGPESPQYERTRQFYEKLGYKLAEVIDPYPGWEPGNPCAIYKKDLS